MIPISNVHERLVRLSTSLGRQYASVAPTLQARLAADDLSRWADHCERLAQSGWRAWESAEAFCHLSPFFLQHRSASELWAWAETGKALARQSSAVATAFFRATRLMLPHYAADEVMAWVEGGQWFLEHYPTQPSLAVSYFQVSPLLRQRYSHAACDVWLQLSQDVVRRGVNQARQFFELTRLLLDQERLHDPTPCWQRIREMVPQSADLALQVLERYPDWLHRFGPDLADQVQNLVWCVFTSDRPQTSTLIRLVGGTLTLLPMSERRQALAWCEAIGAVDAACMLEFLQQLPSLLRRLGGERLQAWIDIGLDLTRHHLSAGQAYFALESATANEQARRLQGQVTFAESQRVLRLYTEGFTPRRIELCTTDAMPAGLQRGEHELPTSNGKTVFVPPQVETFAEARDNFAVYKVAILHQLGFYSYGTFTFTLSEWQRRMPQAPDIWPVAHDAVAGAPTTAFARFFASFDQPDLARQLFTLLEDARIDAHLGRDYKGLRRDLERLMRHSLAQRPASWALSLRQALLEGLLQQTLGGEPSPQAPLGLRLLLAQLAPQVGAVQAEAASVYDTVAAVATCYHLITQVPLWATTGMSPDALAQLEAMVEALPDEADMLSLADLFRQAGEGADEMPVLPEGEAATDRTDPVPYRGDMKPELIEKTLHLQDRMDELEALQDALNPIPPEVLKELLEKGDVKITSMEAGDLAETSGLFMTDLEGREAQLRDMLKRLEELEREVGDLDRELIEAFGDMGPREQAFFYDEWDYLIQDYRPEWCRLTETILDGDDTSFVEETRRTYADLLHQVRRQFQLLKPELFRKIKRLMDGEEIDLDSAIEALVDRRAGNALSEKVYMRRDKRDREVAAVFLLDMSASTDDDAPESPETEALVEAAPSAPRRFDFSGFISEDDAWHGPKPRSGPARRRVIDVEKEALILMAEALETLGDAYAVYGFSGYGRDQVDFFVAKEFSDPYNERTQGRIAAMKPHRSTRMGPAIRHAIRKLDRQQARIKTLLMLSDGYPQDYDYGKDRKSKDYGIQDTMMALREAQLKGIQTFCITVDPSGHDYLRDMCPDQQYLVIDDIAALPDELPKVYRGLTT